MSPVGTSAYWEEPFGIPKHQYGDGKVNFNVVTPRHADSFELEALATRHSWARGRIICVESEAFYPEWTSFGDFFITADSLQTRHVMSRISDTQSASQCWETCRNNRHCTGAGYITHTITSTHPLYEWRGCSLYSQFTTAIPLSSTYTDDITVSAMKPKYIRMSNNGVGCPAFYRSIKSFQQCKDAFDAIDYVLNGVEVQKTWIDPSDFVKSSTYQINAYTSGCIMLPSEDDSYDSVMGFEWKRQQYTLNPNEDHAYATPRTEDVAVGGHSVCVIEEEFVDSKDDIISTFTQSVKTADANILEDLTTKTVQAKSFYVDLKVVTTCWPTLPI